MLLSPLAAAARNVYLSLPAIALESWTRQIAFPFPPFWIWIPDAWFTFPLPHPDAAPVGGRFSSFVSAELSSNAICGCPLRRWNWRWSGHFFAHYRLSIHHRSCHCQVRFLFKHYRYTIQQGRIYDANQNIRFVLWQFVRTCQLLRSSSLEWKLCCSYSSPRHFRLPCCERHNFPISLCQFAETWRIIAVASSFVSRKNSSILDRRNHFSPQRWSFSKWPTPKSSTLLMVIVVHGIKSPIAHSINQSLHPSLFVCTLTQSCNQLRQNIFVSYHLTICTNSVS